MSRRFTLSSILDRIRKINFSNCLNGRVIGSQLFWGVLLITGGYSLGYAFWALFNRRTANQMIAGEMLLPKRPLPLIACAIAGIFLTLTVCLSKVVLSTKDKTPFEERWIEEARPLSALNLLIPLMYLYWQWRNHWKHHSVAAVIVAISLGLMIIHKLPCSHSFKHLKKWLQHHCSPTRLIIFLSLLFFIGMSRICVMRHRSFNSGALDLAMMDQLIWNTSRGRFLEGTFISQNSESFLGHHFSPILAILAPIYWVIPSPEALVILQVAAVASSSILIHFMSKQVTGSSWLSLCFSISFLLNPFLHEGVLFDFHQDALGMLFLTVGLLGSAYGKRWWLLGWVASLLCKEEIAIYWVAFGLFKFFRKRDQKISYLLFAVTNVVWLAFLMYILIPAFQSETNGSFMFFQRYEDLGGTPIRLVVTFLANPVYALRVLLVSARLGGLGVLIVPIFLVFWRADPSVSILLIPLSINFLSSLDQQYSFTIHYAMLPLVMVYTLAIYGANRAEKMKQKNSRFSLTRLGIFSVATSFVLFSWLSPLGLRAPETLSRFKVDVHDRVGQKILDKVIPASASVVAQNTLVPHLSQREHITLFPRVLDKKPEYYVFDVKGHLYPLSPAKYHRQVAQIIKSPDYGPVCVKDGYIVLKKGAKRTLVPGALQMLNTKGP
jgi:uncharacterized membrane protein